MFTHTTGVPYSPVDFAHARVTDTWQRYDGFLTWGRGQTLAALDDGCDMSVPEWNTYLPWGRKVIATWNVFDNNDNPAPGPLGYHGTSVGYPSSLNHNGKLGVAYNNYIAQVRSVTTVHLPSDESPTMAAALRWVIDNHQQYNITTVNFAMLDDKPHQSPLSTSIDAELRTLRQLGIWVSAPCGNNDYTNGISWPACQPDCFGIGAVWPVWPDDVKKGTAWDSVFRDRWSNTAILVPATATSSSNAYICGASMILREAIAKTGYRWQNDGATLPDAMMAIFKRTGADVFDQATWLAFKRMDLLAAVEYVVGC